MPPGRECCHCGDWMDDHVADGGHSPVSMGPEPTYRGETEGWCPDHGFWYYDQGGDLAWSPEHPSKLLGDEQDGKVAEDQGPLI